jgi:hypothetical protein
MSPVGNAYARLRPARVTIDPPATGTRGRLADRYIAVDMRALLSDPQRA